MLSDSFIEVKCLIMSRKKASDYSIVEYYAEHEGYRCGYCKSSNSNYSHGMWAHTMTVDDYQDLIDRGWRRSGQYCYKPTMNVTCCPMYTIRCEALEFKISKSQKKNLKRIHRFLEDGEMKGNGMSTQRGGITDDACCMNDIPDLKDKSLRAEKTACNARIESVDSVEESSIEHSEPANTDEAAVIPQNHIVRQSDTGKTTCQIEASTSSNSATKTCRKGLGMDPSKPPCKKAKLLRLERRRKKLAERSVLPIMTDSAEKSLESYIFQPLSDRPAHRLEVRMVPSCNEDLNSTFEFAFEVYKSYQMAVHGDAEWKCSRAQFTRFLVNSPLKISLVGVGSTEMHATIQQSWSLFAQYQLSVHKETPGECDFDTFNDFLVKTPLQKRECSEGSLKHGLGSFHQQYWLDDRLIAVGVIDILPRCVSSVYFFYDPQFAHLTLGTYGSLREVSLVRSLSHLVPSLRYYYMGYYIHSCPKMRYKARLQPSSLLCPETYTWLPVSRALPVLDRAKYTRLQLTPSSAHTHPQVDINQVMVLFNQRAMPYAIYKVVKKRGSEEDNEVTQYAQLVGATCAFRMLLNRN